VENAAQLEFLRERGCTEVAGIFLSPPLPADAITRLLSGHGNFQDRGSSPAPAG
jgi:EAL domain-containing protein (putative c-di-GMP-specific phosphodiesterase class I)